MRVEVAAATDRYLLRALRGSPASLYGAASHLVRHGGKRLRPYMVVRSCQMLGGTMRGAMPAAAAVEMVHNFTLVHDDMMDNDEVRHGVPTVHEKFGGDAAILAGDVLFSRAFGALASSRIGPDGVAGMVSRLAGACAEVCEGQQADIEMGRSGRIPSEAAYVAMISKKTAALFEVSCAMGAISASAPRRDVARLASFGRNLGIAFQMTDDLMGTVGDSGATGKPVGNDIREGKKSLPVLLALGAARGAERRALRAALGNARATARQIGSAADVMRSLGVDAEVRRRARTYARRAGRSLAPYGGPARDDLARLLDRVVERVS
ncbi:MAG: polyprenyl synthetase family protein [Nitrosopumilus sp.]|nr:polyprenyl synthetase family protein [Nitrosopumilus sp.]